MDLLQLVVLVHQNCLFLDPLSVKLVTSDLQILTFSPQVDQLVLLRIFALIISLAHKLIMQFIQSANFMLLLLIDIMTLLDLHLVGDHQIFLIILLSQSLIFLLPQQFDLTLCIQLINFDPGNLIQNIFQLNLLLLDVIAYLSCLF